jgi:hypothetical protein
MVVPLLNLFEDIIYNGGAAIQLVHVGDRLGFVYAAFVLHVISDHLRPGHVILLDERLDQQIELTDSELHHVTH